MKTYNEINTLVGQILPASIMDVDLTIIDEKIVSWDFSALLKKCFMLMFDGDWLQCESYCDKLLDLTWEKLNTGHWKDVHISWNYAYSYLSFIFSICKLHKHDKCTEISQNAFQQAIQICDKGILMGAPVLDNILPRLITKLNAIGTELTESHNGLLDNVGVKRSHEESASIPHKLQKTSYQPDIPVDCTIPVENCPSLEYFKSKYMDAKRPVVITEGVSYWPAFCDRKWTIEYLKKIAGCRTVPIELGSKYTETSWSQKLMTVREFIEKYIESGNSEIGYLAQHQLFNQIPELEKDISIPTYCCLGEEENVDVNAWFGPKGTVSPLHQDPKHNLLVQVFGEKYIILYQEKFTKNVYPHQDGLLTNTSQVDVENPDSDKFPLFKDAPYMAVILKPGDMLYIPPKCWHYVRSLSVSFSVSFWFE